MSNRRRGILSGTSCLKFVDPDKIRSRAKIELYVRERERLYFVAGLVWVCGLTEIELERLGLSVYAKENLNGTWHYLTDREALDFTTWS